MKLSKHSPVIRVFKWSLIVTLPVVLLGTVSLMLAWNHYWHAETSVQVSQNKPFSTYYHYQIQYQSHRLKQRFNPVEVPEDSLVQKLDFKVKTSEWRAINSDLPHSGRQYIKTELRTDGASYKGRLRLRGSNPLHWRDHKRSLRVKLDKQQLYGMNSFELIAPSRKSLFNSYFAHKLAGTLGLLSPRVQVVWLSINGQQLGLYLLVEPVGEQLLINNQLMPHDIYEGEIAERDAFIGFQEGVTLFDSARLWDKEAYLSEYPKNHKLPLELLIQTLHERPLDSKLFSRILDYPSFARWFIFSRLVLTPNTDDWHNFRLYFDYNRGRFYPLVYDAEGWRPEAVDELTYLEKRLLTDPEFQTAIQIEWQKIQAQNLLPEFQAAVKDELSRLQAFVELDPLRLIDLDFYPVSEFNASKNELLELIDSSEKHLLSLLPTISAVKVPPTEELIWSGNIEISGIQHIHQRVRIEKGTEIKLSPDSLLIFHSGVHIDGSESEPVVFQPAEPDMPYASIVIQSAESTGSTLRHCQFRGGSKFDNGVIRYKGMLSIIDTQQIAISDCEFRNNHESDEMLHITYADVSINNSIFREAFGDAIDTEIARLKVTNSQFIRHPNEAIDAMMTELTITNNRFEDIGDNILSIGQNSMASIEANLFADSKTALLVKDSSYAEVLNNRFQNLKIHYKLFRNNDNYTKGGELLWKNNELDTAIIAEIDKHSRLLKEKP